ncbi:hypothetical protein ACQP2P_21570 [Dactylosporangium sp. CA-139114]|uniref:hypothetical protein n=1 Tax=Dactylosporangium sp. CA-139114 TaxID=3239931 RepID=UPI003D95A567
MVTVAVAVPPLVVARMPTVAVPAAAGVPVIAPVAETFTRRDGHDGDEHREHDEEESSHRISRGSMFGDHRDPRRRLASGAMHGQPDCR